MKVLIVLLFVSHVFGHSPGPCDPTVCLIKNNCWCSSTINPLSDVSKSPQLIALTISESVVQSQFDLYWKPLLWDRKNPDGGPVGATFYVNHEYTDYRVVNNLWGRGFEIGVHSITKNSSMGYWGKATVDLLASEFKGQKEILTNFGYIPEEEISGGRIPQLLFKGNTTVEGLIKSGLSYDNTWATRSEVKLFPYTLDYASTQQCTWPTVCPKSSYPGFWIVPITNIHGADRECNSLATCNITGTADEIASWLRDQIDEHRNTNRSPLVLRLDSYWFEFTDNSQEGFQQFLDNLPDDVYLVNVRDIIQWMKNPQELGDYSTPTQDIGGDCDPSRNCRLRFRNKFKYMGLCGDCPDVYPWLDNPDGTDPDDN